MLIVVLMLFLAIYLTVNYFPRFQKLHGAEKKYRFEAAKEISPDMKHFSSSPINHQLPEKYNENYLTLLVRDPEWLFAYWEIHNDENSYGSKLAIRVNNLNNQDMILDHYDVILDEKATRFHIHVNKPDNKFHVVIGRKMANGDFIPILQSNIVTTPRFSVSNILDKDWLPPVEYAHLLFRDGQSFSSYAFSKERKD